MKTAEAIEICRGWLSYLDRQRAQAKRLAELARMAREGKAEEAQKELRMMDRSPVVYDGAELEKAVRQLLKERESRDE